MQRTLTTVLLLIAGFSAGCMPSLQSDEPPDRIYWLETAGLPPSSGPEVVPRVEVVPGLDSDRIWILQRDQRLNYFAGARWPDNLRPLLQSLLERSLNLAGESNGSVMLEITVERFFAVETSQPERPRIELRASVAGRVRAELRCLFEAEALSNSNRLRDIVAGHQQLLDEFSGWLRRFAEQLEIGAEIC